ncbi:hypothetical protein I5488_17225 [Citrobacter braakii]|nr:hypothetical protein [Citrobacter braakii]
MPPLRLRSVRRGTDNADVCSTHGFPETGREEMRDLSAWFSQVRRQQSLHTVPVMSEPPTTKLTKATGMATATIADAGAGDRGNGVQNGTQCIIEFMSDAPSLDFRLVGGNYQGDLYVDGQRISEISVNTDTSGAPYIYTVDWSGEVKVRAYRLVGINTGFGGSHYRAGLHRPGSSGNASSSRVADGGQLHGGHWCETGQL